MYTRIVNTQVGINVLHVSDIVLIVDGGVDEWRIVHCMKEDSYRAIPRESAEDTPISLTTKQVLDLLMHGCANVSDKYFEVITLGLDID